MLRNGDLIYSRAEAMKLECEAFTEFLLRKLWRVAASAISNE